MWGPNPMGGLELGLRKGLLDEYKSREAAFLTSHSSEKVILRQQVEDARSNLLSFTRASTSSIFDWMLGMPIYLTVAEDSM